MTWDLESLHVFVVVYTHGSFTGAARSLGYSQSSVSKRIAQLERATGARLFQRQARGVRLTAVGRALLERAEVALQAAAAIGPAVEAVKAGSGGVLRIGAFPTANAWLVPAALVRLRQVAPGLQVHFDESLTSALLRLVREGRLDVAVVSDYPAGIDARDVRLTPLVTDRLLVALPEHHPLATQPVLGLTDLRDENWLEAGLNRLDSWLASASLAAGFEPRIDLRVRDWTAKQSFVAAGLGVTVVPALGVSNVHPGVRLRSLSDGPRRNVYVALPGDGHEPEAPTEAWLAALRSVTSERADLMESSPASTTSSGALMWGSQIVVDPAREH